jgi:TP901 family phage tail tape measure protein
MADFVELVLGADTKGLKNAERDLDGLGKKSKSAAGQVDVSSRSMVDSFKRVGGAIATAFAISGSIGSVIRTNADFGASMQKVAAISGATGVEFDKLRETAKQMGSQTMFSASEAADALGFLAMAGFSASQAMESIPSVLALAQAGAMDLATTADIASNVLSGFRLEAAEMGRVANVLAFAASNTNTSISQLGQAMSTAAPIAAQLGISIEETAAALGVMADAGIQGERGGTALRGVFSALASGADNVIKVLDKYKIKFDEINPEKVGLTAAMDRLAKSKISTADAMTIFGREAASGALVMINATNRMGELTEEAGGLTDEVQKMADTMSDSLNGDILSMQSAIEGLTIAVGDGGATGALRAFVQAGTEAVRGITNNLGPLINTVAALTSGWVAYRVAILAASIATSASTATFFSQAGAIAAASARMGFFTSATAAASVATRTLTGLLPANPFTAAALAVGVLTAAFVGMGNAQRQARAETDNLIRSLVELARARSVDFAGQRDESTILANQLRDERSRIELSRNVLLRGAGIDPGSYERGELTKLEKDRITGISGALRNLNSELTENNRKLLGVENSVRLADKAFQDAEDAAGSIVVPAAQAANAIASIGESGEKAKKGIDKAKEAAERLNSALASFFPERAAAARVQENLEIIMNSALPLQTKMEAQFRALGATSFKEFAEGFKDIENQVAARVQSALDAIFPETARERQTAINLDIIDRSDLSDDVKMRARMRVMEEAQAEMAAKAKEKNKAIGDSFATMADRALSALDRLANGIRGGGFLDILGGIIGLGVQLGGMGVFGKTIATNINSQGKANGGHVSGGQGYIVGERGPEFFRPTTSGSIIPNNAMGGGQKVHVTVGVDPANGNITAFVNGQIAATAPAIAQAGAGMAQAQMAQSARRRVR